MIQDIITKIIKKYCQYKAIGCNIITYILNNKINIDIFGKIEKIAITGRNVPSRTSGNHK